MKKLFLKQFLFAYCLLPIANYSIAQTNYSKIVNPFIGTGGHGHTFPGAVAPFGMVQLSPDTRIDGSWDGCSGYHQSDSIIYGFSHTHLSGTGCSDYGDIMLMPMMGEHSFDSKIYSSKFSHQNEKANAGFYSVHLNDDDIDVELTTTTRVGFHKYTFNKSGKMNFILDLLHRDKLLDGDIKIINNTTIEGYRRSEAWAKDQRVYFRIEFSKPYEGRTLKADGKTMETGGAFEFNVKKGEQILVKVSISGVDDEGAKKNMLAELPHWNFEKVRTDCEALWNKELDKIQVKGGTTDQQIIFYTALYHCFIHPSIYNDVDGRYLGRDMQIHKAEGFNYYTVFSLWDTFRALHPLFNIVQRERNLDFIKTFLEQYKQIGRLPMWELSSNETNCMIGNHAISVIADAYAKGIRGFDVKLAIEACEKTANIAHLGIPEFRKKGYLEVEDEHESVSKTLEYAYDDWCLNQLYSMVNDGEKNDYYSYIHTAYFENLKWQNVFNPKSGFMQPRNNGGWLEPFNAKEVNNNYTEANSWQYTFFVPQDVYGLIDILGGSLQFEKKLDELFETSSETVGRQQADITGLIGQYAHGNEPSHHMAYLYNFVGKPYKTQERIQQILKEMYHNAPDGLAGNEDCGQMSAWYVFSAMGFYPVTPGKDEYEIGSPIFNEVILKANKRINTFLYKNKTPDAIYVNTDGPTYNADFVNHKVLSWLTELSNPDSEVGVIRASFEFNCSQTPFPVSIIKTHMHLAEDGAFLPSPIIETKSKIFKDSLLINIYPNMLNNETRDSCKQYFHICATDSCSDHHITALFIKPFYINKSSKIYAYSSLDIGENYLELKANATFHKISHNWTVKLNSKYNKQYTAGGDAGIIDGLLGYKDWRKGGWQGYQSQDFEAIVDLQEKKEIREISSNYLQDSRSWILLPKEVEYFVSNDGINFKSVGKLNHNLAWNTEETLTKNFVYQLPKKVKARYIKVVAKNYGKLPEGHQGFGGDAFIFVDEIEVK